LGRAIGELAPKESEGEGWAETARKALRETPQS